MPPRGQGAEEGPEQAGMTRGWGIFNLTSHGQPQGILSKMGTWEGVNGGSRHNEI